MAKRKKLTPRRRKGKPPARAEASGASEGGGEEIRKKQKKRQSEVNEAPASVESTGVAMGSNETERREKKDRRKSLTNRKRRKRAESEKEKSATVSGVPVAGEAVSGEANVTTGPTVAELAGVEGGGVAGGEADEDPLTEDDCEINEDNDLDDADNEDEGDDVMVEDESRRVNVEEFNQLFGNEATDDCGENEEDDDSGDDVNDDRIPDPYSSDDEEEGATVRESEDPNEQLALGRTFSSAEEFKLMLLRYSLKTRYDIKFYKTSAVKIGAMCSDPEGKCDWRVYCSYEKRKRKLMIRCLVKEHICIRSGYSKMLKRSTIAHLYSERLRLNPKITRQEMADEIKREYGLTVTVDQCGKAKSKVMRDRRKSHEEHFGRIWDYEAEILMSNPGSTVSIETIPGTTIGSIQRFYRMYVCFEAQRESWKSSCRPIIGLDGAFLKWDIKGQLLAAVGRDADNRIVPIAWAVVEIENDTNWDWFVRHLSVDLELNDGRDIAILSDKQKGLVKAIHNVLPQAEHRQCCRHILDNWKKDNHDLKLQRLFWKIARSYTEGDFLHYMEKLRQYSPGAYESLLVTKPETWSRAFFRIGSFCNDNLNNLCESFNRTIREARRKPLLDMLEEIRRQCMVRNAKRSIIAKRLRTQFTKRAHVDINKMEKDSKGCRRLMATWNLNEVDHEGVGYAVDMGEQTCGCRKWQMTGIPCIHATCVILSMKRRIADYVSFFYTKTIWVETYNTGIRPVQGMRLWPRTNRLPVAPPPWRRGNPGRPKNYDRLKKSCEPTPASNNTKLSRNGRVMTCSNCKEEGHNKLTCKNARVDSQPKRQRGRPRKFPMVGEGQGQGSQGQSSQGQGQASWWEQGQTQAQASQWWGQGQAQAQASQWWGQGQAQAQASQWWGQGHAQTQTSQGWGQGQAQAQASQGWGQW